MHVHVDRPQPQPHPRRSYGFIAKGASSGRVPAAVMRGPMVGKVVQQMLSGTEYDGAGRTHAHAPSAADARPPAVDCRKPSRRHSALSAGVDLPNPN